MCKEIFLQKFQKKMLELKNISESDNEATTRLRIIDSVLFDVLDWDKSSLKAEEHCREGYADYSFYSNNQIILVLEAKRHNISFTLKQKYFKGNEPYSLNKISKECKEAADAFEQAIKYAISLGARYVAISNGHQWLISLSFVEHQPIENRLVYVFESLDSILENFDKFFECFSRLSLEKDIIRKDLVDKINLPPPMKISSEYPKSASKNFFQNEIAYILDYVWQIMEKDEETVSFLEKCYIKPNSHKDTIPLIRKIIEKRNLEDRVLNQNINTTAGFAKGLQTLPIGKPFVILGDIGRGKSSFLKHLRFVEAKNELENYIQIDFNFLDRPDSESEIPKFIYSEIERQLRDNYKIDISENDFVRGVLDGDILKLKKTPKGQYYLENDNISEYKKFELDEIEKILSDKHTYFTKVFSHLKKGREQSLAFFFDNLDRRDIKIQEKAFLKASSIARDWLGLVFICLRPNTYYKSKMNGVLDSISTTTFDIGQPDISLVLKKRFFYAKEIAEGKSLNKEIFSSATDRNITLDLPKVSKILGLSEFSAKKRNGIVPILEAVSNGNLRYLIDLTRKILSSGYLDTSKILESIDEYGICEITAKDGLKALLYGDYIQYSPQYSHFINIFDVKHNDETEHFICSAALLYLLSDTQYKKCVKKNELDKHLCNLGYSSNLINEIIGMLVDKQCIQKELDVDTNIRDYQDDISITSLGKFHLCELANMFEYLDAILIDTPILDEKVRTSLIIDIKNNKNSIRERISRTKRFINYLEDAVKAIRDESIKVFWQSTLSDAKENIEKLQNNLEQMVAKE